MQSEEKAAVPWAMLMHHPACQWAFVSARSMQIAHSNIRALDSQPLLTDFLGRWENPLMGWTSTADCLEHLGCSGFWFWTQQEAEGYCKASAHTHRVNK